MYKRLIIPFELDQDLLNTNLVNKNKANYDEITRQIFEIIILDLNVYHKSLTALPNTALLTDKTRFHDFSNQTQLIDDTLKFREIYLRYAMNIYFTCFEYKLFEEGVLNYLLEHINEDSFLLYSCNPVNF